MNGVESLHVYPRTQYKHSPPAKAQHIHQLLNVMPYLSDDLQDDDGDSDGRERENVY